MIKSISNEDLKKAESVLFNHLKNNVMTLKSEYYKKYLASRVLGKEIHHLLGSLGAKKGTDYLAIGVTRSEHDIAEKNKSEIGIANLSEAINHLINYTRELEIAVYYGKKSELLP